MTHSFDMDAFQTILSEIGKLRKIQDATYEMLTRRIDEIDKERDMPLTRQQAAYYLNVSVSTIDRYRMAGMIKPAVRGRMIGYLRNDLAKLKK